MKRIPSLMILAAVALSAPAAPAADKVVVVPLNTGAHATDKLWGKGRPRTAVRTHTTADGYCTTSAGVKYALSVNYASWGSADQVCPAGKWVCRLSDLPASGACDIEAVSAPTNIQCDGTTGTYGTLTYLMGYVADAYGSMSVPDNGYGVYSHMLEFHFIVQNCNKLPAWCCWQ